MSTIHDQAMNYVYQQVLQRLLSFFSRAERTALQLLIQRLVVAAGGMENIGQFKVLVHQSGLRDSCYTLALLRAAQLTIAGRAPATFQLRVASLRWNGDSPVALQNLHRSYSALFLYDDPRVEVLMVDNREVLPFDHRTPVSDEGREASRVNLLLVGHCRTWLETPELWDEAYLATAEYYSQIARWNNGVDAMISTENKGSQQQFLEGLNRAMQRVAIAGPGNVNAGFEALFPLLDGLGDNFYGELLPEGDRIAWCPEGEFEACRRTSFIDINDMMVGKIEDRWLLLGEFLGYEPDDLALYQGEAIFADPLISAHVRGLYARFIEGRAYEAGIDDYVRHTLADMRRKQVAEPVCEHLLSSYDNAGGPEQLRTLAEDYLSNGFGLNETQLACLLFAPFIDSGKGLERFLRNCHPGMLVAMPDLHRAMQGLHAPEQVLKWLTEVSGLPVRLVIRLYAMGPVQIQAPAECVLEDAGSDEVGSASPFERSTER
ncbi:hypothetical protein PspCFBP13508_03640 [Pseudomonas sp. CFBP13508]|uniref:hypothetical protein n=1 Tax=Pseudomonas sp. CFBP13508 TaxID=2184009 RepID=UPI0010C08548|nr:hypothetical protein [Pseudomonas sp. CFBP13508]TKJ75151.1 hypothetical protein PspCFBP13508_03640 [Pseudomonas sp. CFBP13508]